MPTTKNITSKQLPVFSLVRCKRCGICSHFCPVDAIAVEPDGAPYLADPVACTSCGLCSDMCPDWAVYLEDTCIEPLGDDAAAGNGSGTVEPALFESTDHDRD